VAKGFRPETCQQRQGWNLKGNPRLEKTSLLSLEDNLGGMWVKAAQTLDLYPLWLVKLLQIKLGLTKGLGPLLVSGVGDNSLSKCPLIRKRTVLSGGRGRFTLATAFSIHSIPPRAWALVALSKTPRAFQVLSLVLTT